ncbi:hypothetical protein Hanom_Chr12g01139041 [Helianthus anomalus]
MAIKSEVLNQKILVNEATIRTALQLDDNNHVLTFIRAQKDDVLKQMGYHTQTQQRAINKHGFIKPWQYLVTQMSACFSMKVINHHEVSLRLMEPILALVLKEPYNFSYYLMIDFSSNMWVGKPFLMHPRFLTKILTS